MRTRTNNAGAGLKERVARAILERDLIRSGERAVVAVSGGLDSICLLHLMGELSPALRCQIHVAHLNHQLRGRDSAADARFVKSRAKALGVGCTVASAAVREHAAANRLSIEMAGRELRRRFLAEVAEEQRSNTILLAHHADDQVELFFLRLLRGSGSEGLRGMLWKSQSEHKTYIHYVRPLLGITRPELEAYAAAMKLKFREDASNQLLEYERNRVRHLLLPALEKISPRDCRAQVLRAMELLGSEASYLGSLASAWLQAPARFDALHGALQRRIIHQQLLELGLQPEFDLTESLRLKANEKISVGPRLAALRKPDGLLQLIEEAELAEGTEARLVPLADGAGEVAFGGAEISWQIIEAAGYRPRSANTEVFDATKVGPEIRLRHWRAGDRFQPIGLVKPAKLQDLLTNAKIPAAQRRKLVVAEASEGGVFWVEGLRIGELAKVTAATRKALVWQWKRA